MYHVMCSIDPDQGSDGHTTIGVAYEIYVSTPVTLLLTWINFNPGMDKQFHPL